MHCRHSLYGDHANYAQQYSVLYNTTYCTVTDFKKSSSSKKFLTVNTEHSEPVVSIQIYFGGVGEIFPSQGGDERAET